MSPIYVILALLVGLAVGALVASQVRKRQEVDAHAEAVRLYAARVAEGVREAMRTLYRAATAAQTEIEQARRGGEFPERDAHDRRGAGMSDGGERLGAGGEIVGAVLLVERDGGEAFARQRLRQQRQAEAAPAGKHGFAGAQAGGEREALRGGHAIKSWK